MQGCHRTGDAGLPFLVGQEGIRFHKKRVSFGGREAGR
jgi:hypothetical protein